MLRSFFVGLSHSGIAQNLFSQWGVARRLARRFIAGETLEEAIEAIRRLNQHGIQATLDHLGENTTSREAADHAVEEVLRALAMIEQAGVRANVSIKLSQLGLNLSDDLCLQNLSRVVAYAAELDNFIRIDMEDAGLTGRTLQAFFAVHDQFPEHCGIVIQSYLYRSQADIERIVSSGGKVRLCKGAYQESPQVAYPHKPDVDASYDLLAERLLRGALQAGLPRLSGGGRTPPLPAFATHDERRIQRVLALAASLKIPPDAMEFQMLYGIRRDLQETLANEGFAVRVYVPYGTHWYPYFMRRLGERPANVWFIVSNIFR